MAKINKIEYYFLISTTQSNIHKPLAAKMMGKPTLSSIKNYRIVETVCTSLIYLF